jgi:serpin B
MAWRVAPSGGPAKKSDKEVTTVRSAARGGPRGRLPRPFSSRIASDDMGATPGPAGNNEGMTTQTLTDEAFGTDMYRLLAQDNPDLVFSPASVAAALRMALCGARGETAAELAAALHLDVGHPDTGHPDTGHPDPGHPDPGAELAAEGLRQLDALVASTPSDITFRVANTAWVQSGLPLLADFTARLGATSTSTIAEADFAARPDQARRRINAAIEEQTGGKITNLLGPGTLDSMTRLVLANAVYLKAPWANPFPEQATKHAPFQAGAGRPVTVPMMHGRADREYVRGDGYQAVLLPYRASRLAMVVVLPDGPLDSLGARPLHELTDGASTHRVTLSLPRFRVEADTNLTPVLRHLGVRTAFGGDADFSGITSAERLRIGAAVHKAYVDVDEQGTEAAAATAVTMVAAALRLNQPPPVEMIVDHPFLFAIIDTVSGLPLFLGQVTNPGRT